jgi:hypothetical protein
MTARGVNLSPPYPSGSAPMTQPRRWQDSQQVARRWKRADVQLHVAKLKNDFVPRVCPNAARPLNPYLYRQRRRGGRPRNSVREPPGGQAKAGAASASRRGAHGNIRGKAGRIKWARSNLMFDHRPEHAFYGICRRTEGEPDHTAAKRFSRRSVIPPFDPSWSRPMGKPASGRDQFRPLTIDRHRPFFRQIGCLADRYPGSKRRNRSRRASHRYRSAPDR